MHPLNTFPILKIWKNISISKKLYFVVGAMALLIIIELLTLRFAMSSLSALRAFVGGEASWSKAQKNAVYRFQRYVMTKDEWDYLAFGEALKIPDGDRRARVELQKTSPDMQAVREGFIQGHVHPADIESIVNLLRRFYWVSYIQEAVAAWSEGDRLLIELREVVWSYRKAVQDGVADTPGMEAHLDRVIEINNELTRVEEIFSRVLGEGSRWLESIVFVTLFILVITVESIGLTLTFFTSRSISRGLFGLNKLTEEFSHGNFDRRLNINTGDEIGQLTQSINTMGDMLQKSYQDLQQSHKELEIKVQQRTAELAEIANQNSELYQEAKNAVRMRDDFLSIASHELRTPLTALNLQFYLLERVTEDDEKTIDFDQMKKIIIRASLLTKKLSTLQEVLMDLAQLRLGKLEIKREMCDIIPIVTDCVSQLNSVATRGGSEITFESESSSIIGNVDCIRVGQVVTNLLSNAIKYGEGKAVQIKVFQKNEFAIVEVSDNGQGIPFNKQDQIFDRFERVNEDPAVSGLGLGLYISKQIVEAHRGSISVESNAGKGTKFIATFFLEKEVTLTTNGFAVG
ncbi:ATP-binding protein [Bacteriovorax sp. PP10]|uniref:histidine kinase n=1 Tax=Bacteriovorax antarcticus TaxID=3088717 RepID=A0ABU5VTI4_9BACT|nr:ATP-binding protein [Bacteriovorax sp. PP10]MEA9355310.1 ATP-binding protein [Bacteriovorax sp. PP10]